MNILHVGFPKCASTYIQEFLEINRASLQAQDIHQPPRVIDDGYGGTKSLNLHAAVGYLRGAKILLGTGLPPDPADAKAFLEWLQLDEPGTRVISVEVLSLIDSELASEIVRDATVSTGVVVVRRNYADQARSAWWQGILVGIKFPEFRNFQRIYLDGLSGTNSVDLGATSFPTELLQDLNVCVQEEKWLSAGAELVFADLDQARTRM